MPRKRVRHPQREAWQPMTYNPAEAIEVSAWDRSWEPWALDPTTGYYAFEYDENWVRDGADFGTALHASP